MSNVLEKVTGAKIRLLRSVPFFGTLMVHAEFVEDSSVPLAATDGRRIMLNPGGMMALSTPEFDFVILHEVMHCALSHLPRLAGRDAVVWNYATDAIINEAIAAPGLRAPDGVVTNATLAKMLPAGKAASEYSAEELYALLQQARQQLQRPQQGQAGQGGGDGKQPGNGSPKLNPGSYSDMRPGGGQGEAQADPAGAAAADAMWRRAMASAKVAQERHERNSGKGSTPAGVRRLMDAFGVSVVDWRQALWQYLTAYPTDYVSYDRRLIHSGSYIRTLDGQQLTVHICIDTSGSISDETMQMFYGEVQSIMRVHTHVNVILYFADAALYGPHEITAGAPMPEPMGGGGTSFVPFFRHVTENADFGSRVLVYLTDGFGDFPVRGDEPSDPVVWAVIPGGLATEDFPFGEVVRLVD